VTLFTIAQFIVVDPSLVFHFEDVGGVEIEADRLVLNPPRNSL
jgi:hypothetical protein